MDKKWWVSWYCPEDKMGKFELNSPWWITGETSEDDEGDVDYTVCAAIRAETEEQAKDVIIKAHDNDVAPWASGEMEWRFVTEKSDDWSPFGSRFPKADWMEW